MSKPTKTSVRVSDHAFLRYAERVMGFDREQVYADLARMIGPTVELCPDCRVPFVVGDEHFIAVVQNRTVKTIVPREFYRLERPKKPKALRPMKDPDALKNALAQK